MSKLMDENSPALSFISSASDPDEKPAPKKKPAKKKAPAPAPSKEERRDIHVNLVLKPSLADALKDEAWTQRRSLNNLVEEILTEYVNKKRR